MSFQSLDNVFQSHDRSNLQQTAQYNHVECFGVVHLIGGIHSVDAVNVDILTCGRVDNAVAVVDKYAAGLYLTLELLQRGLVQNDSRVVFAQNG